MANQYTEADVVRALEKKYSAVNPGNGPRYVYAAGVRNAAGWSATRTADFIALDTWESGHLHLYGHEIKCSRADWLSELKDPDKAEAFKKFVNYWYLVVSDKSIVKDGELPDDWGLMALDGRGLVTIKKAPLLTAQNPLRTYDALPRSFTTAFLRSVQAYAYNRGHREAFTEKELASA